MAKTYEDRQELLAKFWTDLREELDPARVAALDGLPLPCLNHVEDRLGKPDRAVKLAAGCQRLCAFAPDLLVEGRTVRDWLDEADSAGIEVAETSPDWWRNRPAP